MKIEDVCIPVSASWSSPFVRWQGPAADVNSLDLARQVTQDGLARTGIEWPFRELVLGITVPQKEAFYGAPTLAARLGLGRLSGPMLAQACATSVACVHWAAADQQGSGEGARLVVTTDRTSNGPHLVYPSAEARRAGPRTRENWVLDNFGRDPVHGRGDARDGGARRRRGRDRARRSSTSSPSRRYEQYLDALADDRAFQREWMVPIVAGSRRKPVEIDEDWGVRPVVLEELRALGPVEEGGVVSYGTQTHPADGSAGMVVTSPSVVAELGVEGPVAHPALDRLRAGRAAGRCRRRPSRRPRAALADAGIGIDQVDVIKTHNPFAVNDVWFARELGVDADAMNPFGSSLVYGHPQAPTGARGIVELLHALVRRGGGVGLFTGCAAGDYRGGARRRGRRVSASIAQPSRRAGALRRRSVGPPAARSVLLTVLGEYVMPRGGSVWQETLVEGLVALGHTEQTARQAVARSTRDGWLDGERFGRRTRMTITPETRQMLEEGRDRIFGFGDDVPWDGRWLVVVLRVPEEQRRLRHHVRTGLARAGMGSLGGGVWIGPHVDREPLVAEALRASGADAKAVSFRADAGSIGAPGGRRGRLGSRRARGRVHGVPRPLRSAPAAGLGGGVPRADRARPRVAAVCVPGPESAG